MADIVGTAFVRIKALTTGLAKDIEKNVSKAAKDADVDSSGELIGDELVKGAGRQIKAKMGAVVTDAVDGIDKKVDVDGGRRIGDRLGEGIKSGLSSAIDSKAFKSISAKIIKLLGLDEKEGNKRGRSFARGILGAIAKFGVFFAPGILSTGSLILQYFVALTAQLGLLAVSAVGAGAALGTVIGAAALGIVPLILAFKANTAELGRFKKVAEGVGKDFLEIGAATQETLLPGLTEALELSRDLIPAFRGFGREIGKTVGALAEMSVREIVGDQERLRNILQGSARIFESLSEVAFNFVSIFLDLFEAALPIGEAFADALERISDRWQNLIGESADSGRLSDVLQTWFVMATFVTGALGDLLAAIFDIFEAGSGAALPFFDNFAVWAAEFREFTSSEAGQNRLKQIFDDALEVASAFNGLIVDISRRIGAGVFEPGGNEGLLSFIAVLQDDIVPFLDTTFRQIMEDMGPALRELAESFGEFLTAFAEAGGLEAAIQLLGQFFDILTQILNIPGMDRFIGALLAIAAVGKVLKITGLAAVLRGIGTVISAIVVPAVTALATVLTGFGLGFAAAVAVAIGIIVAVIGAIALLVIHWDKVKAAFDATVRFFKDPMARLEALRENIENLIGTIRDGLGKGLGIAGRALASFGGMIRERVEDAIGAVLRALSRLPGMALRALGGLASAVLRALAGIGGILLRAFTGAITALLRALPGLILDVVVFFVTLPLRILAGLARLAEILLGAFVAANVALAEFLGGTVLPAIVGFFSSIPGHIVEALSFLAEVVGGVFSTAIDFIVGFFVALPGRIVGGVSELPGLLAGAFQTAVDGIVNIVSTAIDAIVEFFTNLPGTILGLVDTIASAAADIGGAIIGGILDGLGAVIDAGLDVADAIVDAITGAFKTAWNAVIDEANDLWNQIEVDLPVVGTVGLPDDILKGLKFGALGGIFNTPTQMIIGEAGPEVLIPLTNPRRALELFNKSGLSKILEVAQRGRNSDSSLQSALRQTTPGSGVSPAAPPRAGGNVIIHSMNIEAPTPLETARQVSDRLRITQSQLVSR